MQDSDLLKNLGLSNSQPETFLANVRFGANFEDSGARSLNHFYNPVNGMPIPAGPFTNYTSPDWALEDRGDISDQAFSYKDARKYFYDALTKTNLADRDKKFGLMFQTLGQVMHHIQDMAQPQHVRNDAHCDAIKCWFVGKYNPSLYEEYSNIDLVRNRLPFFGYAPPYPNPDSTAFDVPRKFWDDDKLRGLADFTNLNFVSAGTNFDRPELFYYPKFDVTKPTKMRIEDLCANRVPACSNPKLTGIMNFYGNDVTDRNTGATVRNPFASTNSVFDADLTKKGMSWTFTLNRFNFELAHVFLIPRAVGYSAGLIDYFFRGEIDFVLDPANPGKYVIKNLSDEKMTGTFALYYDDKDGKRHITRNKWDLEIDGKQSSESLILKPIEIGEPEAEVPDQYMLVFNGAMGKEEAGSGTPATGAVAAKQVQDPLLKLIKTSYTYALPNKYNPMTTYNLDAIVYGAELTPIVVAAIDAHSTIRADVGEKTLKCRGFSSAGVLCWSDGYPYTELQMDTSGISNGFGFPYLFLSSLPTPGATVSLLIDDVLLFRFTFVPQSITLNSPIQFKDTFHVDSRGVTFGNIW